MKKIVVIAWRNLWRNKRRTLITVSSVVFAVIFSVFMRSMQHGTYENMIKNVVEFYSGYIQIHKDGYWDDRQINNTFELTDEIENIAKSKPQVSYIIPRLESFGLVSVDRKSKGVMFVGISPDKENKMTKIADKVIEGSFLDEDDDGVLVSQGVAEYLNVGLQDTLVMLSQGYHGVSAAGLFPIKGIVKFPSPELNRRLVLTSIGRAQDFFSAPNRITALLINVHNSDDVDMTVKELSGTLDKNYEVMSWHEMNPELVQQIESDNASAKIFMGILYVIVGFGVFGTILMMTAERKREFGVMVAVGMKRTQLSILVFLETLFMSFTGAVVGMVLGLPIVVYFYFYPIRLSGGLEEMMLQYGMEPILPVSLDPEIFVIQGIIVFVISFIAALYPVISLLKLNVIKSLRA